MEQIVLVECCPEDQHLARTHRQERADEVGPRLVALVLAQAVLVTEHIVEEQQVRVQPAGTRAIGADAELGAVGEANVRARPRDELACDRGVGAGNDGLIWPQRDAQLAPPPTGLLMA
jgi:hypothetical protein